MKTLVIALVLILPLPIAAVAESDVTLAELKNNVAKIRKFKPIDQFDVGPDLSALVGRSFNFEVKPYAQRGKKCPGMPTWYYKKDKKEFYVEYGRGEQLGKYWTIEHNEMLDSSEYGYGYGTEAVIYGIDCLVTRGSPYTASNALGASVTVFPSDRTFLAFAFLPDRRTLSLLAVLPFSYWGNFKYEPNEAREISKTIRARVIGRIGKWKDGKPIVCGTRTSAPTFSSPQKTTYNGCFVNAMLDRVEIFDSANDEILKSWDPNQPRE